MADRKLSALVELTTAISTDELYINDGGISKKITLSNMGDSLSTLGTITGATSITSTAFVGPLTGNASTATSSAAWTTTRTIDMSGDVSSDSVNIDGSGNITITNTVVTQHVSINDQTGTTYTFVLTDDSKYVRLNNAAAITLTIPTNALVAFPIGTQIALRQVDAGQVTIAGAGVTINTSETLLLRTQGSSASLLKVGTDEWDLSGDLEAV